MKFSQFSCYIVPLRSKYSPQHLILKYPQPTFLPQYQRSSFTPIQNNRQNYISVCPGYVYTNLEERVRTSMPQVEITATIPVLERLKAEEKVCARIDDHEGQR
jgi:hypothetical protein